MSMFKKYYSLFIDALKDNKLPTSAKVMVGLVIGYFIAPIDLVSEAALPGIGLVDDLVIAAVLVGCAGKIVYDKTKSQDPNAPVNNTKNDDDVIDI